jgi:phage terminase large subunit-like protein
MLDQITQWRTDPVSFMKSLINPETGQPFELYPAQERFFKRALTLTPDGQLPFPEMIFSCPKKSGKTTSAALATLYVTLVLGGPFAETYIVANDEEQAIARVFTSAKRIVEATPWMATSAKVFQSQIEFSNGSIIKAIASEHKGAAGANPTLTVFDELWGYTSENAHRLWDEMVPVPTRRVSGRLTVTYAGYEGESTLLESLYKRGLQGKLISKDLYAQTGMLMFWSHEPVAPWQTPEWLQQMRQQLRPNAYLRMVENRWVSSESTFVDVSWWDACIVLDLRPVILDVSLPVWIGVDASVKKDSTALVGVTWDSSKKKVRLVNHRIFQPKPTDPLDFEATIEQTLLDLKQRFAIDRKSVVRERV